VNVPAHQLHKTAYILSAFSSVPMDRTITQISSQFLKTKPKFPFEVSHPLQLLLKMAKKLLESFNFCLCAPSSSFCSSKLAAILTFKHVLSPAEMCFPYKVSRAKKNELKESHAGSEIATS